MSNVTKIKVGIPKLLEKILEPILDRLRSRFICAYIISFIVYNFKWFDYWFSITSVYKRWDLITLDFCITRFLWPLLFAFLYFPFRLIVDHFVYFMDKLLKKNQLLNLQKEYNNLLVQDTREQMLLISSLEKLKHKNSQLIKKNEQSQMDYDESVARLTEIQKFHNSKILCDKAASKLLNEFITKNLFIFIKPNCNKVEYIFTSDFFYKAKDKITGIGEEGTWNISTIYLELYFKETLILKFKYDHETHCLLCLNDNDIIINNTYLISNEPELNDEINEQTFYDMPEAEYIYRILLLGNANDFTIVFLLGKFNEINVFERHTLSAFNKLVENEYLMGLPASDGNGEFCYTISTKGIDLMTKLQNQHSDLTIDIWDVPF